MNDLINVHGSGPEEIAPREEPVYSEGDHVHLIHHDCDGVVRDLVHCGGFFLHYEVAMETGPLVVATNADLLPSEQAEVA